MKPENIKEELFDDIKAFVWTSLTNDEACKAIEKAIDITKKKGGKVFAAPSMSILSHNRKWAKILISKSDVISLNKEEAKEKYPGSIVWVLEGENNRISVKDILKKAGEENITSIMIEGGSETFTRFVEAGVVDKYLLFISPSFLGDGIPLFNAAFERVYLKSIVKKIGDDFLVEASSVYGNN